MDRLNHGERDFRRVPVIQKSSTCLQDVDVFPKSFKGGTGDHQIGWGGSGGARLEGQDADRIAVDLSGCDGEVLGEVSDNEVRAWIRRVHLRLRSGWDSLVGIAYKRVSRWRVGGGWLRSRP